MIREQEKTRITNVYNAVKKALKNKGYRKKTTQVFAEIASEFGYESRSVSNIYYAMRKEEEKTLHQIRVSKNEGKQIAQWFKDYVTKWYELEVQTKSDSKLEHFFSINEFAEQGEYSFDFSVEAYYRILKFGNGIDEPIEHEVKIDSYSAELMKIFNPEGEEIILQQKYIQEIEDHFYSVLKLQIIYYA